MAHFAQELSKWMIPRRLRSFVADALERCPNPGDSIKIMNIGAGGIGDAVKAASGERSCMFGSQQLGKMHERRKWDSGAGRPRRGGVGACCQYRSAQSAVQLTEALGCARQTTARDGRVAQAKWHEESMSSSAAVDADSQTC